MPRDPRQPDLIEAPSRSILDVVQEGLRGFKYRHRDRLEKRRQYNEKQRVAQRARRKRGAVQKSLILENEVSNVKAIKVTYVGVFKQPTNKLNPSGLRINAECPVEVFLRGGGWCVRSVPGRVVYEKLGSFPSAQSARDGVRANFAEQVEDWQMWGEPPLTAQQRKDSKPLLRMIQPEEVTMLPTGVVCWKEAEDFTHIMHTGPGLNVDGNAKAFRSACGEDLKPNLFISTKANVEPTCTACAEVWRREYKGK